MLFGVSDGGAHTKFLTAGRYPTETLAQQVRDNHWITYEEATGGCPRSPRSWPGFAVAGCCRSTRLRTSSCTTPNISQ
jgi:hypothetical protein